MPIAKNLNIPTGAGLRSSGLYYRYWWTCPYQPYD